MSEILRTTPVPGTIPTITPAPQRR
jgi:hypothetical protein